MSGAVPCTHEDVLGGSYRAEWLRSPNRGFRGQAPINLILSGQPGTIITALEKVADGRADPITATGLGPRQTRADLVVPEDNTPSPDSLEVIGFDDHMDGGIIGVE
ncbi:MAG: MbcA/ParS/Xre antitoxin family protein [Coriobacteriia bacterium]|nr:MbcA/ParS/Xre antitoxin family protein [Coriobacteriia bacterium]